MRTPYVLLTGIAVLALLSAAFLLRTPAHAPAASPSALSEQPAMSPTPSSVTTTPMAIQPLAQKVLVTLNTSKGVIRLELDGTRAPLTVGNFVTLAQKGFYTGTTFHRVIPGFMIQAGDPLSKDPSQRARYGTGGPGYTFPDEINSERIVRGTVAMANAGPDTNGSQFFIVTADATPHLDGKHTNFGKVISGMDAVDAIVKVERDENDNPITPVVINTITVD
jgi:peptidyl-prolyl cis-trans isomerase B (cyclophilin B)